MLTLEASTYSAKAAAANSSKQSQSSHDILTCTQQVGKAAPQQPRKGHCIQEAAFLFQVVQQPC
jgi:hypothetical protein